MALKTINYLDKRNNEYVPAIAIVEVNTIGKTATFYIGKNRELIEAGNYYEKRTIAVDYSNRKENPRVTAYNYAKGVRYEEYEGQTYEVKGILYGWEDDYI